MIALQDRGEQVSSSRQLEANLCEISSDNRVTNIKIILQNYKNILQNNCRY
jgi:hypothetical protein